MSVLKFLIYESLNQHCYRMCGGRGRKGIWTSYLGKIWKVSSLCFLKFEIELQRGEICKTPPAEKNVNAGIDTLILLVMDFVSL